LKYRVLKTRRFKRSISKLDKSVAKRILRDLEGVPLEDDPASGKPLKDFVKVEINGRIRKYRLWELKVGPKKAYRLFYMIEKRRREVYLLEVMHRSVSFR